MPLTLIPRVRPVDCSSDCSAQVAVPERLRDVLVTPDQRLRSRVTMLEFVAGP
ncbi:MAG: hypothetical protein ACR2KL_02450 [Nocardioidaceae bacterium]